jgi:hypothetical protein
MLDFLKELVQDVPDPSAGGTIDLEAASAENKKKRGKGKRPVTAAVDPTTNPTDPDAPAPPKKRRRKKKDDDDGPAAPQRKKTLDEDVSMQEDPDEYDEDDSMKPPPVTGESSVSTSYRPRSPVDDDYED